MSVTETMAGLLSVEQRSAERAECSEQPFPFSMAFQPIVKVTTGELFAYEALIRGLNGESALSMLSQVTAGNREQFDRSCRETAMLLAKRLRLKETGAKLCLNFMPGASVDAPAGVEATLKIAQEAALAPEWLIFEMTETEEARDQGSLAAICRAYRSAGFQVAMDDFGAGFRGLSSLAELMPGVVKVDMELTRNLHQRPAACETMRALVELCRRLEITLIAKGVQTRSEYDALLSCGVEWMQGFLLARPAYERLPKFTLPRGERTRRHPEESLGSRQFREPAASSHAA